MLVLSRKAGEAIILAGNIKIQVLGIEHDRVKLGVEAPPDVLVLRSELLRDQYRGEYRDAAHYEQHEQHEQREPAAPPRQRYEFELPIESAPARQPRPYSPRQPRYNRPQNGREY